MASTRRIKLKRSVSRYVAGSIDGIRLRVEVLDAHLMASKVFQYRLLPTNPDTGEKAGMFSHVCSIPDLAEVPEDAPLPGADPPWFRLDYVDVVLRSREEADEVWERIRDDVDNLRISLDLLDEFAGSSEYWLGTPVFSSFSSSSSSSSLSLSSSSSLSVPPQKVLRPNTTISFDSNWESTGTPHEQIRFGVDTPQDLLWIEATTLGNAEFGLDNLTPWSHGISKLTLRVRGIVASDDYEPFIVLHKSDESTLINMTSGSGDETKLFSDKPRNIELSRSFSPGELDNGDLDNANIHIHVVGFGSPPSAFPMRIYEMEVVVEGF